MIWSTLYCCRKSTERSTRKSHSPHLIGFAPESTAHIQHMGEHSRQQKLRRFDGAASFLTARNTFHVLAKTGLHDLHKSGIQLHASRRVRLHHANILSSRDSPCLNLRHGPHVQGDVAWVRTQTRLALLWRNPFD